MTYSHTTNFYPSVTRTSETLDLALALLEDGEVEHAELGVDDAAAHTLTLALTSAARIVALGA